MAQTVLPFKLEATEEKITVQAGSAILVEFIHPLNIFPQRERIRGFATAKNR